MSPYQSSTKQIQSPYAWTFVDLNVDETGACWTAERNALRDIKPKGLVVRYPNPFGADAKLAEPEILYETSDAFDAYWRSPKGEHHVLGKKHHFQDAKGKWKTKELGRRPQRLVKVDGFGDRVLIGLGWPASYLALAGGEYQPLDIGDDAMAESIVGTGPEDILIATAHGLNHFDGAKWTRVANAPVRAKALSVSKDLVYVTGVDPERGKVFHLYRGNARDGFTGLLPREPSTRPDLENMTFALGSLYLTQSGDVERGLYRYDEASQAIEKCVEASGYTGRLAGNDQVLWFENGIELLCTDGKTWRSVPRVHHDKSKA